MTNKLLKKQEIKTTFFKMIFTISTNFQQLLSKNLVVYFLNMYFSKIVLFILF